MPIIMGETDRACYTISNASGDNDLFIDLSTKQERLVITGYHWNVSPLTVDPAKDYKFIQWMYILLGMTAQEAKDQNLTTAPPPFSAGRRFLIADTLSDYKGKVISYTEPDLKVVPPATKAVLIVPAADFKASEYATAGDILTTFSVSTKIIGEQQKLYFDKYRSV